MIPFLIKWQNNEPIHAPNFAQLDVLANLVAKRLAIEEMFTYASKTPLPKFDESKFDVTVSKISAALVDATYKRLSTQPIPKKRVKPAPKPAPKAKAVTKNPSK